MPLIIRRILAFCIDYILIAVYAGLLLLLALTAINLLHIEAKPGPILGQIIGFVTLTLPVICYGYFLESSHHKATLGKKWLNLKVTSNSVFLRNVLKFLPWEVAHTGVQWVVYYSTHNIAMPIWVWLFLIVPQIVALGYFISLFVSKGERTVYDSLSESRVEFRP